MGGLGLGAMGGAPQPNMGGGMQAAAGAQLELPNDLGCMEDPRAKVWQSVKKQFRSVFGESGTPPFEVIDPKVMKTLHQAVTAELNANGALAADTKGECGY